MSIACRIATIPTARIARRRSYGLIYGLMVSAIAVEAYHRRPEAPAPGIPSARHLAQQLTVEAPRHLATLPLRMRPKMAR